MTWARRLLDATLGRRLLVRIWIHGVLLFGGVVTAILVTHNLLPLQSMEMAARGHPQVPIGLAERALAVQAAIAADRPRLSSELHRLHDETSIDVTLYDAAGTLLASSAEPPLAAMTSDERRALSPWPGYVAARRSAGDRYVVGAFRAGALAAYAVAAMPAPASIPLHPFGLFSVALVIALVFVALPLSRSIARPLEQLGAVARELGAGKLSVRAPTDRRDEIGDLSR